MKYELLERRVSILEKSLLESMEFPNGITANTVGELVSQLNHKDKSSKLDDIIEDLAKFISRNAMANHISRGQFSLTLSDIWDTKLSKDNVEIVDDGLDHTVAVIDRMNIFLN